jgi:hypothetical protein
MTDPTPTDWRALCAELVNELHDYKVANEQHDDALVNRARAALARPEPQGPDLTACDLLERFIDCFWDEQDAESYPNAAALVAQARAFLTQPEPQGFTPDHVNLMCFAFEREPWATWLRRGGCLESAHCELSDLMLAVLARWGRPAIEPVPEPQGPSELELEAIELKLWDKHRTKGYMGEEFMYDNDFSAALDEYRAALARYGTPAIEPVPVSEHLPGPEDCDEEGQCWWWDEDDDMWRLSRHRPWLLCWTHWLPHWALPVPAPANTINQNNY